jgi:hypothetical protein
MNVSWAFNEIRSLTDVVCLLTADMATYLLNASSWVNVSNVLVKAERSFHDSGASRALTSPIKKSAAAFSLINHTLAINNCPQPCHLQPQDIYLYHTRYTMPPSTPSASDTGSASQAASQALTDATDGLKHA